MERALWLGVSAILLAIVQLKIVNGEETILSAVLTPNDKDKSVRQERSYYERYGSSRFNDDRPSRCGRCLEDRYDDRDDRGRDRERDRGRDRYDDDRRSNRPTYGNRHDRNKNYDNNDDDRRYSTDRNTGQKNGTEDNENDTKKQYDDKDRDSDRPSGGRRDRDRGRYDDRDKYSPDYYDRFLRDPHRDRYDRPYYDDLYRERRPYYDRYDEGYGGRYDGYGYPGYRRPVYEDRYDRGTGYDYYGGYGPGIGRGPHDRPWDETYRGQAGWDAGGRGYYFASGRPDAASAWPRPEYSRPEATGGSWQNVGYGSGYSTGYRDPVDYRGSVGYSDGGYRQDFAAGYGQGSGYGQASGYYGQATGYGQASGWRNVGERRPYRDQRDQLEYGASGSLGYSSGGSRQDLGGYGQSSGWIDVGERRPYRDQSGVSQSDKGIYKQPTRNDDRRDQNRQTGYGQQDYQQNSYQPNSQSTATPATSYLYQREDERVTKTTDETTKTPS